MLLLFMIKKNSVDLIWRDRPASQNKPLFFLEKKFSGCSSLEKIKKIKKKYQATPL